MRIIITEEQKKKLFIPRKLSGEDSRWSEWNKEQPIIDGVRINQYDINTGIKQGYWEFYYGNGQLDSSGSFKNGKRDGIWESYHGNGQLWSKGSYKNGEMDGIWESYWDNGQLQTKNSYKNDKQDGIWEWYYKDGQLESKGSFKNGKRDGYWEFYSYNRYKWYLLRKGRYIDGIFYDE
jgi:antitoxin component YwqK of YwqJK toxin-antitoxin module